MFQFLDPPFDSVHSKSRYTSYIHIKVGQKSYGQISVFPHVEIVLGRKVETRIVSHVIFHVKKCV